MMVVEKTSDMHVRDDIHSEIESSVAHREERRGLQAAMRDGAWNAVQVGVGETYLGAYAIALSSSAFQVGLISTLPLFIGALMQLLALRVMVSFPARNSLLARLSSFQALMWIPIASIGWVLPQGIMSGWALLGAAALYYASANMCGPVWNSLIGDIVPPRIRGIFFGKRNRTVGFVTLVAIVTGGWLLDLTKEYALVQYGFTALFLTATVSRLVSSYWLGRYPDPPHELPNKESFSFLQFINRSYDSNFLKFVLFVGVFNLAMSLANPFISVYLLRDLQLEYSSFTAITSVALLSQLLLMARWGALQDEFGTRKIMIVSTIVLAFTQFLWLVSSSLYWLLLISALRGTMWAGYLLSTSTFLFDAVTPSKRARCSAYQAVINNFFVVMGSLFGGLLGAVIPSSSAFRTGWLQTDSNILTLFLISGMFQLVLLVFLTSFREVREVTNHPTSHVIFRLMHIRPFSGIVIGMPFAEYRRKKKKLREDMKEKAQ